jgi:2-hydroxychromene-2-carboxylate isomerase
MTAVPDDVRFYFSFRSPYSWLALVRIDAALADLPVKLEYVPVFPPPNFANDPTAVPNKLAYIQQDVARIAAAYGLPFKMSDKLDCEWVRPHASFLYASDRGTGPAFARGAFDARFSRGMDLGDDAVLAEIGAGVGLDAQAVIAAARDPELQTRVVQGMMRGVQEDSIFGVPYFVHRGERYWGNDRIDWLVRAIKRAHGMQVADLTRDLTQPVDR